MNLLSVKYIQPIHFCQVRCPTDGEHKEDGCLYQRQFCFSPDLGTNFQILSLGISCEGKVGVWMESIHISICKLLYLNNYLIHYNINNKVIFIRIESRRKLSIADLIDFIVT